MYNIKIQKLLNTKVIKYNCIRVQVSQFLLLSMKPKKG